MVVGGKYGQSEKNIKGCILLFLLAGIIIFLIWFFVAGDKKILVHRIILLLKYTMPKRWKS